MRIAVVASPVTPLRPAQPGGAQAVLCDLAAGLTRRGHDVVLYCAEGSEVDGVKVVTGPSPRDAARDAGAAGTGGGGGHRLDLRRDCVGASRRREPARFRRTRFRCITRPADPAYAAFAADRARGGAGRGNHELRPPGDRISELLAGLAVRGRRGWAPDPQRRA